MSTFEFVFSFFSLLLGFSLVEVLGGLVRAVKARRKLRLGWLTPMLGIFVLLHVSTFWIDAWQVRDQIPATDVAVFVGLIFTGTYYFAASLVFPERIEEWADLDVYYMENKRQALVLVLLCDTVNSALGHWLTDEAFTGGTFIAGIIVAALLILAAIVTRSKRANFALLAFLIFAALLAPLTAKEEGANAGGAPPAVAPA